MCRLCMRAGCACIQGLHTCRGSVPTGRMCVQDVHAVGSAAPCTQAVFVGGRMPSGRIRPWSCL